jgi:hypothetical protein
MPKIDARVDADIKKAKPFAQPILNHLRELVHRAVPEVEETKKSSMTEGKFRNWKYVK